MEAFIIKTNNFEGPFELLFELIKKREMDIYDLHISDITKDYMKTLEEMRVQDIDVTSDFMEMASMLLEIKSKMLIPVEVNKDDPRNELVKQLLEYQEYKETVEKLKILSEFEEKFFKREKIQVVKKEKNGTRQDLLDSFQNMFKKKFKVKDNKPFDELAKELGSVKFTIEDRMISIKEKINFSSKLIVSEFFDSIETKAEMVATFGAILELVKVQFIDISIYDDVLYIERKGEVEDGD